ncbi:MAG: hypothetical protein WBR35_01805 [Anaerolineae bacterium]
MLVLPGTATLSEMVAMLAQKGYSEYETYVVVNAPAGGFRVVLAAKLLAPVKLMGPVALKTPLIELPIPPATEVVRQDTQEGGGSVEKRLTATPGAVFVVVNDAGFVALFVNANLSGGALDAVSYFGLHGEYARLGPGVAPLTSVKPPTCPHCGKQGWYRFEGGHYVCQACKHIVETP